MKQLIHNGILVMRYEPKGFKIRLKDRELLLSPEQEEMIVAWVKKLGTDYVKDEVFVKNFFKDFSQALSIHEKVNPEDFDFYEIQKYVEDEKNRKLSLSKVEKKQQAQTRKALREANKEKYGYAIVDGMKVELANYIAEPSSIFMGRGKHPLRGMWKRGAKENDIILNLSTDAPTPLGNWKERVWYPDFMWIARWDDKLSGKEKYVWFSDSAHIKQEKDIEKFDKAKLLEGKIKDLRAHIKANLSSTDLLRRKIATVCYLIDTLKLRVGDEKDKDEADTVGATTLRPEHIKFKSDGTTVFDFLGKDSVKWLMEIKLPEEVTNNIRDLASNANSSIFKGVNSENVRLFLNEVVPGLSAKVFRTYHASKVVNEFLRKEGVSQSDPDFVKKYVATMANLEAAKICNHKRTLPKNWQESLRKKEERLNTFKTKQTKKSEERVKELSLRIKTIKATRDYNLTTSLKSYIDPRIYHDWSNKVGYDWKLYYSKTLQRKFQWVEGTKKVEKASF